MKSVPVNARAYERARHPGVSAQDIEALVPDTTIMVQYREKADRNKAKAARKARRKNRG